MLQGCTQGFCSYSARPGGALDGLLERSEPKQEMGPHLRHSAAVEVPRTDRNQEVRRPDGAGAPPPVALLSVCVEVRSLIMPSSVSRLGVLEANDKSFALSPF